MQPTPPKNAGCALGVRKQSSEEERQMVSRDITEGILSIKDIAALSSTDGHCAGSR